MTERAAAGVVGSGPSAAAARAALGDRDIEPEAIGPADAGDVDLAVVIGPAGHDRFETVDRRRAGPWVAVELGGIGGRPVDAVDATVAVLRGDGPCYRCLVTRVRSTLEDPPTGDPTVAGPDARLAGAIAGRLAVATLDGADRVGTVVELPYAERRALPVPGCRCDDGGRPGLDRAYHTVDFETTVGRAEAAVDERLGPVAGVGEAESFPAPYYLASLCDTAGFSDVRAGRQAAGVAADWDPAFVKAVGEALERYAAGVYRESAFTVAPEADLDDAVSPSRFVRPAEGYDDPAPDEELQWAPGTDLNTGAAVLLPAERVRFPPTAERLGPAITTGLGLGTSGAGALRSGLTEVVERDATMLAWYSSFEPLRLTVDDPGVETLARRARSEDLAVTPLLVTQDVDVPVVTVAVHREGEWPRFAVGSAAALDPVDAVQGGLEEALQNWMELRGLGREAAAEEEPRLARYAALPPEARTLVDVEETVPADRVGVGAEPEEALDALLGRIADAGLDAYAARLTPRDVAALGFEVVRVLVPEAQPLFTGERFFGDRARTVPRSLGFRPRLDRGPHPYP